MKKTSALQIGLSAKELAAALTTQKWHDLEVFAAKRLGRADSKPDGLDEKWGVDLNALARKLDSLTLLQKCALLAAMDGFFKRSRRHT
jgi:hypothetical protein